MSFEALVPWLIAYLGIGFGICVFLTAWDIISGDTALDDYLSPAIMLAIVVGWGLWVLVIITAWTLLTPTWLFRKVRRGVTP